MQSLKEFYELEDAEEYFDFFDINYNQSLVNVKRFHILREYGTLISRAFEELKDNDEAKLLDFLKFSLLRVYGEYENGKSPSAVEVWNLAQDSNFTGCMSCTPSVGNSCGC